MALDTHEGDDECPGCRECGFVELRNQMCPDCRQPNKLTRRERYDHKHCDECTEQCRVMMNTPAAHIVFEI